MPSNVPLEDQEQVALARWLDKAVGERGWFHVPNEGRRSARTGKRLKDKGLKPGVPDVIIVVPPPRYPGARGTAIELKRRNETIAAATENQLKWCMQLKLMGWMVSVRYGAQDAVHWLQFLGYGAGLQAGE